ncbi:hypothetical protein ACFQV8_39875 [Pseudonocardia benzenivorans]
MKARISDWARAWSRRAEAYDSAVTSPRRIAAAAAATPSSVSCEFPLLSADEGLVRVIGLLRP